MQVTLAKNYGFCFGVKRAIEIAELHKNSATMGPLIHNQKEIDRLKTDFNVGLYSSIDEAKKDDTVIIRTHGIPKDDLAKLKQNNTNVINATCPFVTTPQQIVKRRTADNYSVIIFGDESHPEVKGIKSYGEDVHVVLEPHDLENIVFKYDKLATIAQTTKQKEKYLEIVNWLILRYKEVRVFNTICDATFENQAATKELSEQVDIMVVIGGKNSSNTKQLFNIASQNCQSYLIEDETEVQKEWFDGKKICGVTAGASTPDWIIQKVVDLIRTF